MSDDDPRIPERVREYFGHDRVAHHGRGGLPAAPPAPPGSTARKAGETALADALRQGRHAGPRPGQFPAALPPARDVAAHARRRRACPDGGLAAALRAARRAPPPHERAGWFWRSVFAPVYERIPWGLKRRMVDDDLRGQALAELTAKASAGRPGPQRPVSTTYSRPSDLVAQVHHVARQPDLGAHE